MTDDGVPDHLDLPDSFDIDAATSGDRVESADGTTWVVIHPAGESKTLVHADIVEFGTIDHPLLAGLGGMAWLIFAFLAPPVGVYYAAMGASPTVTIGAAILAVGLGYAAANVVLYRTPVGTQVFRFLEYNEYKSTIEAMRQADSVGEVTA
jgi:hypothetical protein